MRQHLRAGALMIVLTAGLCFPRAGVAQNLKIAVVDLQTLTLTTEEGKIINDKVKKKYDDIVAIMGKLQKDIEDKETRLRTQDRVMSATAKASLVREIESDKVTFDRKNQDYQKELTTYQDELLDPVAGKAQAMLMAYIKEKDFSIVVDLSADKGNIVWSNPANDITADLIKRLNDEHRKTLAAAAPVAAAPRTPAATPPAAARPPAPNAPASPR